MQHWREKYRELARECLRSTFVTAEARSLLVEMARVWTRLADDHDIRAQQHGGWLERAHQGTPDRNAEIDPPPRLR
jgi:hypothetical protein